MSEASSGAKSDRKMLQAQRRKQDNYATSNSIHHILPAIAEHKRKNSCACTTFKHVKNNQTAAGNMIVQIQMPFTTPFPP
ncbi:MAG TPA: hypothetical protein VK159_04655 [Lacibacter sp.]|nr:hypothetical protein [Lacibacter sp.]